MLLVNEKEVRVEPTSLNCLFTRNENSISDIIWNQWDKHTAHFSKRLKRNYLKINAETQNVVTETKVGPN